MIPEHELVALSGDGKSFADLAEHELGHCVKIPSKGYACPDLPIFQTETNPSCDTAILTNNTKLMEACQSKVMKIGGEMWLSLQSRFSWIFAVSLPIEATITTEDNRKYQTILKDSGVLTLEPGAKLETQAVKIRAPHQGKLEVEVKFVSSNKIPIFKLEAGREIKVDIPAAPQLIKFATLDKLRKLTMDLKELEKLQDKPLLKMLKKNESVIQYYASLIGGFAIVAVGIFVIWKCGCCSVMKCMGKCCCKTKSRSTVRGKKPEIEIIHIPQTDTKHSDQKKWYQEDQQEMYELPLNERPNIWIAPRSPPPEVPRKIMETKMVVQNQAVEKNLKEEKIQSRGIVNKPARVAKVEFGGGLAF